MTRSRLLMAFATSLGICSLAGADSIWDRRDPRAAFLFHDNRARNVGDLLTITISESTATNERESRGLDRGTNNSATVNYAGSYQFDPKPATAGKLNATGSTSDRRQFNGSAQLSSTRTFVDRMAVTVVDVLPNGNLVFEGTRMRVVAGEERMLRVTGVVRPADIVSGNAVPSGAIANMKISYIGRGQETEFVNQSLIGRAINYLFP
ncbi:flagellar basal body L-ring protein FlgH [Zavarzinella formosa]|uniref:flagellar basal body L-ring protein FlgH n=1 Tax=Zavarzinella formosa TaxID=360055 RepID=UPI0002F7B4A3|nr:flagellar basal body L-ring protein FlgH [Zavarzinella formosa]